MPILVDSSARGLRAETTLRTHLEKVRPLVLGLSMTLTMAALSACAPSAKPPARVAAQRPPAHASPPAPVPARERELRPLTPEEARWTPLLERYVAALTKVGARNVSDPLALADATDWLSERLLELGLVAERQGFAYGEEVQQNLVVRFPGLRLGDQRIVVGAALDSLAGSPGADDNASGAAVLLCLAQRFKQSRHLRSLELVWFSDATGRRQEAGSGAAAYLTQSRKQEGERIRAMLELNGVGAYRTTPGSQRYDDTLVHGTTTGDFIAFVSYPEHADVADVFRHALEERSSLPTRRFTALSESPPLRSAHVLFLRQGIPSMLLYDTHGLRAPEFGTAKDTPERLDYERMARLVEGVARALEELTGPEGRAPHLAPDFGESEAEASEAVPREAAPAAPAMRAPAAAE